MHPHNFLVTHWRMQLKPQVFVAMSFDPAYEQRFKDVIEPAIAGVLGQLTAHRVDLSKRGDSILTEIMEGIAHSELVLADISTIGRDSKTGKPYRNGNVMYEVGLALACRQPAEVLLIRDDRDPLLFDVSTVPHMTVDFTNAPAAVAEIRDQLQSRLNERDLLNDLRVEAAATSLSPTSWDILRKAADCAPGTRCITSKVGFLNDPAFINLLNQGLLRAIGQQAEGGSSYVATDLGRAVAAKAQAMPMLPIRATVKRVDPPDPQSD